MSVGDTEASPRGETTKEASQKTAIEIVLEFKAEGNAAFGQKNYPAALKAYDQALTSFFRSGVSDLDLQANLWNNRAMTLIRLKKYIDAESCCTHILEKLRRPLPKAYHRRATAREEQAMDEKCPLEKRHQLLLTATADLKAALRQLEVDDQMPDSERRNLTGIVARSANKLTKHITLTEQRLHGSDTVAVNQNPEARAPLSMVQSPGVTGTATPKKSTPSISSTQNIVSPVESESKASSVVRQRRTPSTVVVDGSPSPVHPAQQRQDVWRLLLSRQTQLSAATIEGESFFVVHWLWWTDFCNYVDLFHQKQGNDNDKNGGSSPPKKDMILRALPPGAVLPTDDDTDDYDGPPGPINNADLLRVPPQTNVELSCQQVYYRQWHRVAEEDGNVQLIPNLVRGYDYELIPREVYSALREWYGEVTPTICRRAVLVDGTFSVVLYPEILRDTPPLAKWNTGLYDRCGACRRPGVLRNCSRCKSIYYCNRECQQSHWPYHKHTCQLIPSGGGVPNYVAQSEGRVGLLSLGNTCFMNAALQCLSHTAPLTRHFLSGKYLKDLNRTNPLGTEGKLADAYLSVLQDLWMRRGTNYVKPYALKRAIAAFAPRFAGTLQHDSQEFLAYLLDGLHEDINRIRKAPYVEMPDFQDGQNMAVAGAKAWEAHLRRNDSMVLDTFYGQFKSTCNCPQCDRVSVSFDAFNLVSLEIPQKHQIVPIVVTVVRAVSSQGPAVPERFAVRCRKSNPIRELKKELSSLCHIPVSNLHLCEVLGSDIVHLYNDEDAVASMRASDQIVAYEAYPVDNNPCFHALVRHKTDNETGNRFFGLPLLTSFPLGTSCHDLWNHFARLYANMLNDASDLDRVLSIVLHDGRNQLREVFPSGGKDDDELLAANKTAILPPDIHEPLFKFLPPNAYDSYLYIWLEWSDTDVAKDEMQSGSDEEKTAVVPVDRFSIRNNHSSYLECLDQIQAEVGGRKQVVTLDECFQAFTKPERLDERNMWYCSNCKDHVPAMKTMELWRLPDVLVVHLKRFEFRNVLRREKLETFVDYPVEGLDMSKYCGSHQKPRGFVLEHIPSTYDLFGVVQHFGRAGFGHYTAFAREWNELGEMGDWSLFDDATVSRVDGDHVVSQAAYVLFYRRRPSA